MRAPADTDRCLNCAESFGGRQPRFCPNCGQSARERAPTVREFVRQFTGAYLSSEGALWRTLKLLLLQPGRLTTEYLAGRRRHYVLPVRLFLSISVVVLLALRLAAPSGLEAESVTIDPQDKNATVLDIGGARVGIDQGVFFCEKLPDWLCRRMQRRLDQDPKGLARELERAGERFFSHAGTAMALLVPIFAAWMRLAYLGRGLRYAEHLVFALHLHAAWFLWLTPTLSGLPGSTAAALLALPAYHLLAARRVFGGSWWGTLLRAAGVALAYGATLMVALVVLALAAFFG